MRDRYRAWKVGVVPALAAVALVIMQRSTQGSALWYAGLAVAIVLGLAYVVEEVVWNVRAEGRPCAHCGHRVFIKSFRIRNTCPNCRAPL